ncbi:MAG TPA: hypothetical protein VE078_01410, partial [Thermoanaerobaculia bacterium]|nr:hypothetical protein [Thermoanaerobaculia bacterium]
MKKYLLLFVFAVIVLSAAPAMAGQKLNIRVYNQPTDYTIHWKRTQCDCVYHCDHLPGGTIRPHDMWPPGDEPSAQIESKGTSSGGDQCATQPSDVTLRFSTDPSFPESNTGIVSLRKYSPQTGSHWAKINGCFDARDIKVLCTLFPGDNDGLDIRLEPLATGGSKQPATLPTAVDTNYSYRLTNLFRGDGESLEGNRADSPVHDGAAFMDKRQNVSGQLW